MEKATIRIITSAFQTGEDGGGSLSLLHRGNRLQLKLLPHVFREGRGRLLQSTRGIPTHMMQRKGGRSTLKTKR